jgi:hypothetical protein
MDLREIGWGGMDWIGLAQDTEQWRALVNTVINLRGPIKYWEIERCSTGGLSRKIQLHGVTLQYK